MDRKRNHTGPGTSPMNVHLERVLAALLQEGHLTAEERLACFCASKGMAEMVLRHAPCTHLAFTPPAGNSSGSAGSSRSGRAHAKAAQQLAAQSHKVTLALHGSLLTPAACLRQCITTLQLHGMQLDQASGSELQLHKLPRLHTLSLRHCRLGPSTSDSSQQHRSTSVRTLECLAHYAEFLPTACQLVDPSQLQTLIVSNHASVKNHLPQFPALRELHVHNDVGATIRDNGFEQLLAHPPLARVRLPKVELKHSHAGTPCTWQSLHLEAGVSLTSLERMPLAGIQACTVEGFLSADDPIPVISASSHLVLQAGNLRPVCCWLPAERTFEVEFATRDSGGHVGPVVTLVMRHLAPGTALIFNGLYIGSPEVLASLAAAPAMLSTLCFYHCRCNYAMVDGHWHALVSGVITHMPHVRHLVLATRTAVRATWLEQLRLFVAGVTRPLRLTLVIKLGYSMGWQAPVKEHIRQWLATHASEHVHVDFQVSE